MNNFKALFSSFLFITSVNAGVVDLFYIERNKNKNRVYYTVQLDQYCLIIEKEPIDAYWLMLEKGPDKKEKLNMIERKMAYGIGEQKINADKKEVHFKLKASNLDKKKFKAIAGQGKDKKCKGQGMMFFDKDKKWAQLKKIYVFAKDRLIGLPDVKYVDITGVLPDGSEIKERIVP